jgi:primase-polymerase (primpol)-like protein
MTIIAENIAPDLIGFDQWVGWHYEHNPGEPKPRKIPLQCNGRRADKTNPRHQTTFTNVCEVLTTGAWLGRKVHFEGPGFCFMPGDPFLGLDLDNVWRDDGDEGAAWGLEILEYFRDTYSEISPSGCGVKIWCRAAMPEGRGRTWKVGNGAVEMYSQGAYFTVTSRSTDVRTIAAKQSVVDELIRYLDEGSETVKPAHGVIVGQIPYGTQHRRLVSLAGTMYRRGMCVEAIEAALQQVNLRQCERPGSAANITRIARSAMKWQR